MVPADEEKAVSNGTAVTELWKAKRESKLMDGMKQTIFDNKILIVDDNAELRAMLHTFLTREGFAQIALAADCRTAIEAMRAFEPDFVILDVNLPDGDGFSLMRKLREEETGRTVPVLFLSARDKDADRLTGLGLGADDYMVKPFLPKELLLRMAAILKRSYVYAQKPADRSGRSRGAAVSHSGTVLSAAAGSKSLLQSSRLAGEHAGGTAGRAAAETGNTRGIGAESVFAASADWDRPGMEYGYFSEESAPLQKISLGTHEVDFEAGTVRTGEQEEKLTVKELRILETLAQSRGKIVTFDNLCKAVWNAQYYTYENTVMVHIRRLREKIEDDPSHPKWLVTARGIGYKLNCE